MAKKKDRVENELQQGSLTHNPFAALRGGGGSPAPSPPVEAAAQGAAQSKVKAPAKAAAKPRSPSPARRAPASSGPPAKLVVRFEAKGHGGKQVTRVAGLDLGSEGLEALAKSARKALGADARVEDGDVLIQGKLQDRVIAWLAKNGHPGAARGN